MKVAADADCDAAQAPEDRYILFEAEDQGLTLPNACRNGCCTQCAVKVKSGSLSQNQALGISKELRDQVIYHRHPAPPLPAPPHCEARRAQPPQRTPNLPCLLP